jgi:hypothetical protein
MPADRPVGSRLVLARLRDDPEARWWTVVAVAAALVAVPLVVSGPGNDLDVGNVFRSGRAIARHLAYVPSRPPGAPVHEAIVGILDLLGGTLLTDLASLVAAAVLAWSLHALLRDEGLSRGARWGVLLVVANPWFAIAATSTADYVFALAFTVAAARALRADRAVLAGVLAALAMGCRIGSALLVLALLVAEVGGAEVSGAEVGGDDAALGERVGGEGGMARSGRHRAVVAALVAGVATAVLFIPSVVAAGGLAFAQNDFSTSSPLVQVGRALAKDVLLLGVPTTLVALVALPAVVAALRSWRRSWLVRFASVGLVGSQLLFVRFPWKMPHLLPCLLCLAILYAVALDERPRILVAMVALQLVFAVVRIDVVQPDDPNQATGGRLHAGVGWGPVVTDWRCRREHPDAYRGRQKVEIEAAWDCAKPFGG